MKYTMKRRPIVQSSSAWKTVWGFAALCSAACSAAAPSTSAVSTMEAKTTATAVDSPFSKCSVADPSLATVDAATLFAYDHVPTFDLYLPDESWQELRKNALDEKYTTAAVCFEGRGVGTVGLRFKGAHGSLKNCFNDKNVNICKKLGMKLKFDKTDNDNRFFGLKKLNFQSYRYDDSYMKERLAYDLFAAMDIVTPRALWANVRVNGELLGLFGMVEQIDEQFVADRWENNPNGNLYKETWPGKADVERVVSHLKTNEEQANVSAFNAFSQAIGAADAGALRGTMERYTDVDYWARYMAVDDATVNYDGVTAYYLWKTSGRSGNHNFYLYEEGPDRFTIIPWDVESTFSIGIFGNVPHWTQPPEDCGISYSAWGKAETRVTAPGCDPVLRALAADLTPYKQAVKELLDGPFSVETMAAAVDEYVAFIHSSVEADPNGPGVVSFENDVSLLKYRIPKLRQRLSYLLEGNRWIPFEIDVVKTNDFEDQNDAGVNMGPQVYKNASSDLSASVNTDSPINGKKSAVLSFSFADGKDAWGQWINYLVLLKGGARDVSTFSGIRMWIRADRKRDLRIELDSTYTSAVNGWLREGWFVSLTETPTQIEVLFKDAAFPSWAAAQGIKPMAALPDILTGVKGILFSPQCVGRGADGFLPKDTKDVGFIEVDDIELF